MKVSVVSKIAGKRGLKTKSTKLESGSVKLLIPATIGGPGGFVLIFVDFG